jgi:D-ribose pyranase
MKRTRLINAPLSAAIARLGHTDLLLVADAGLPIPAEPERIDLALVAGVPSLMQVLQAIFTELAVEAAIVAEEQAEAAPKFHAALMDFLQSEGVAVRTMSHVAFKQESRRARAAVRTAEYTPYANILLQCGVIYGPTEDDAPREKAVPVTNWKPA